MRWRTLPVFLAFLAMGFGDAVGPFVGLARDEFHLSNAVAALIPFVGFSMFGLLSVPVGVLQDRRGKKFVLLLGLAVGARRPAQRELRPDHVRPVPADGALARRGRRHPAGGGQPDHARRVASRPVRAQPHARPVREGDRLALRRRDSRRRRAILRRRVGGHLPGLRGGARPDGRRRGDASRRGAEGRSARRPRWLPALRCSRTAMSWRWWPPSSSTSAPR